jgi:GNAT superfamily N-acetyltransferase
MTEKLSSVRRIPGEQAQLLRHQILRPHQPPEMSYYPLDDEPGTLHVGAFEDGELVGVGSVFNDAPGDSLTEDAWRIRGMATLESVRGEGYGAALLAALVLYASAAGGDEIWCNARTEAASFYAKHKFVARGEEYELPGLGPHLRMFRTLNTDSDEP